MVLTAIKGALGFLTRLPVGRTEAAWLALGDHPAAMVPVGYLVGVAAALPVLLLPAFTAALAYPVGLVALTGVAHADGLADLADAAVVHGDAPDRRAVMTDTVTGVGGTVAVGLTLVGVALAAAALASLSVRAVVGVVVAAEVGAKLTMVGLAVAGSPTHGGLGDHLLGAPRVQLIVAMGLALPAALILWPSPAAAVAVVAAVATGAIVAGWAAQALDGLSGDVFGAANEVARLVGLHAGVVTWMHF